MIVAARMPSCNSKLYLDSLLVNQVLLRNGPSRISPIVAFVRLSLLAIRVHLIGGTGLFQVTVCQSLFIAPCSHVYHYKCIRPLLEMHHPGFSCPLCRTFADLEADVEVENRDAAEPGVMEDIEMAMALEGVKEAHTEGSLEDRNHQPQNGGVPGVREGDGEGDNSEDAEDGDGEGDGDRTSSSLSSESVPMDADVDPATAPTPVPGAIPAVVVRQDTGDTSVFPGAEATPLNNTFLATLAMGPGVVGVGVGVGAGTGVGGAGAGGAVVGTGLDAIAMGDEGESGSAEEGGSGVGGKRKR